MLILKNNKIKGIKLLLKYVWQNLKDWKTRTKFNFSQDCIPLEHFLYNFLVDIYEPIRCLLCRRSFSHLVFSIPETRENTYIVNISLTAFLKVILFRNPDRCSQSNETLGGGGGDSSSGRTSASMG